MAAGKRVIIEDSRVMSDRGKETDRERVLEAFRRFGFLQADLDALGRLEPLDVPELDLDGEFADEARRIYCGPIGIEFMHIPDAERREWIASQMESEPDEIDQRRVLRWLMRADRFEHFLQNRYLGNKRFSIEGVESLIPLLKEVLETAAENEAERIILAMTHRGRLNVMFQVVGRPAEEILSGFEDTDPKSFLGAGDVKYHLGATGKFQARNGRELSIHLVSNPSHLEAVDPVAMGRARAWQTRLGDDGPRRVVPIVLHGDAAFAGQGILAEVLNLADLGGFSVGGTVQIVVNNLIGFTALPEELHSSRFATDVAKRIPIPIIHVNAMEPDAVVRAARLAGSYRAKFNSDVVVDLIGFRRFGHSEVDDPTITQPLLYRKIKKSPPLWKSYAEMIDADTSELEEEVRQELDRAHKVAKSLDKRPLMREMPEYWSEFVGGFYDPKLEVATGLSRNKIGELSKKIASFPEDFHVHEKVNKLLEQRREMGEGKRPVDFGMAEALAFASLLEEGLLVRLSGQDSRRATFSQRHAVLIDVENEREYIPLQHLSPDQARFEVYDSMLSEAAVLGFEYGFSRDYPDGLVLWEAQFGDFANGAQVIIDQFITAGEDKWNLLSGLVMLLPHGYEGQGPEHSSARLERYLQLAAEDNMQVCQPSTAAQYFHLLRRQGLQKWRKPLIVMTPKSMLRHSSAVSHLEEFERKRFLKVIPDEGFKDAERILVCSGKVGHELRGERKKRKDESTAVIFLEQFYPFPEAELREAIERHPEAREVIWVQEEPANMGALSFVFPKLERLSGERAVRSIKRSPSGSPATGSAKAHELEQQTLLSLPFKSIRTKVEAG